MMESGTKTGVGSTALKKILALCLPLTFLFAAAGCAVRTDQGAGAAGSRMVTLENGICQDTRTGKMWQVETSRTLRSLEEAQNYVAGLKVGGHDDWRLPTVTELFDLYMIFDLHQNGNCDMRIEGTYWSDEPDLEGRVGTWELDDNCDPERRYIPKTKGRVRAVRP